MLIILWILTCLIFVTVLTLLILALLGNASLKSGWQTIVNGFKEGLTGSGVATPKARYPIELYVWETMEDEDVCEDCLERTSWPPMDIADWMKEGLPGTPEADVECGHKCRCRLVRYYPGVFSKKPHRNS